MFPHASIRAHFSSSPMDYRLPAAAYLPAFTARRGGNREIFKICGALCFARNRGFGTEPEKKGKGSDTKTPKVNIPTSSEKSKVTSGAPRTRTKNEQELAGTSGGKSNIPSLDSQFLEKVESVRRSAYEQRKAEGERIFQPIDYDAPIESEQSKIGLATKIGVGVAVVVFGVVFAFGDSFPSGSIPSGDNTVREKNLSEKERSTLEESLRLFQEALSKSPEDPTALEGTAVTLVELGEYQRASALLEKLIKEKPENVDAYRLLGEVRYELKDFEGSASAYRSCLAISKSLDFDVLRGLTNVLLAAKKPHDAVQVLLSLRENINDAENIGLKDSTAQLNDVDRKGKGVDPIQVDLLLGKAYSDWGHVSDAVAVYDQLISKYPNDFRAYLAKGIILKENGKVGDAERMFIQARFFAPEKGKALVDRYSRQ